MTVTPASPTIGRIVLYTLADHDVRAIEASRGASASGPAGNFIQEGQEYPAVVVRVWSGTGVNLQVLLDGPDTYWATSRVLGDDPGKWSWPPRA